MIRQRLAALVFGLTLVLCLSFVQLADPFFTHTLREITFDQLQRLQPRAYSDQPVRIVDIDDASLSELGQWPWPRNRLAEMVDNLAALGAAAIVFDFAFAEPDRLSPRTLMAEQGGPSRNSYRLASELPDYDAEFAAAAARAPVVFAFAVRRGQAQDRPASRVGFVQAGSNAARLVPQFRAATTILAPLQDSAAGIGSMSLGPDTTVDVIRRVPLLWSDSEQLYPGLALEALRVALGETTYIVRSSSDTPGTVETVSIGDFDIPTSADGEVWLHYRHEVPQDYISAAKLIGAIDRNALAPLVEGRVIFVGTSAAGLLDLRATSLGENVPGVAIHAQLLEQILSNNFLQRADWLRGVEVLGTLIVGVVLTIFVAIYGPILSLLAGAILAVVVTGGSWFLFSRQGMLIDPSFTLASGLLVHFAMTSFRYLFTDRQARFIRRAFSQYVAPTVLANIERNPQRLALGGEIRPITIMFVDIRNFTTLSEALGPGELVSFLNTLLSALSDCIVHELGTIDKYIGDSVMAFWNAPAEVPDHAARACRAALAMRRRLNELNAKDAFGFAKMSHAVPSVEIGIGINTGQACVGNMGSQTRFNYSAVGDAVNLAARVESACKDVAFDIVVSQATAASAQGFALLDAGAIRMKGKSDLQPIALLLGDEKLQHTPAFCELGTAHEAFMRSLAAGQTADATRRSTICTKLANRLGLQLDEFYASLASRKPPAAAPNAEDIIAASKQIMLSD